MDKTQQLMEDLYDSSRWYYERSDQQRQFDDIVMTEVGKKKEIETAVKKAKLQMPEMRAFMAEKSIAELNDYYKQVHRIDLEIAIADNMRTLVEMRRKKA